VDDHLLFAEAIGQTLKEMGFDEIRVATTAAQAMRDVSEEPPDMVLVDVGLPDGHGIAVGRDIMEQAPGTKVVALTALEDDEAVRDAIRSGFNGYITKNTDPARFRRALESVADGEAVFPHRLTNGSGRSNGNGAPANLLSGQLTERELEVLALLAQGASGREISERLHISPNTVRTHVQGILSKLQVHSRLEAAAFAVRHDLVKIRP